MKNALIIAIFISFALPFVLIRDVYPFYRMGMFAEPINLDNAIETFVFGYELDNERIEYVNAAQLHIHPNRLWYLSRNYYYRGKSDILLDRIRLIYPSAASCRWHLYRTISTLNRTDTVLVASFPK